MWSRRFVAVLLVGAFTGCSSGESGPSAGCLSAMEQAADEMDIELADPLIIDTLDACESPEEWLDALREYPAAMGLKDAEFVSEMDIEVACAGQESTNVCSDR